MRALTHRTRIIAAIAFTVLAVSTAVVTLSYIVVNKAIVTLMEEKQTTALAEQHMRDLSELKRLYDETKEDRENLHTYVLEGDDVIDFLGLVEALGKEQKVELKTETIRDISNDGKFDDLEIAISVSGSYESIEQILLLFETLPYQSQVTRLDMARDGDVGAKWSGKFTLKVTRTKSS